MLILDHQGVNGYFYCLLTLSLDGLIIVELPWVMVQRLQAHTDWCVSVYVLAGHAWGT